MAFNDTEKTDAKIEQAYLDLLAKTLSPAKENGLNLGLEVS